MLASINGLSSKEVAELILSKYSDLSIFQFYVTGLKIGGSVKSPLRPKDTTPSFSLFYSNSKSCYMFKDHGLGVSGGIFTFVSKLYNISWGAAVHKVYTDLDNNVVSKIPKVSASVAFQKTTNFSNESDSVIIPSLRDWEIRDLIYWKSFGITKAVLNEFGVYPVKKAIIQNPKYHGSSVIFYDTINSPMYAYHFKKDNKATWKLYSPFAKPFRKWRNNSDRSVHQGYTQLPPTGDILLITKSLKDVMSLKSVAGIPAIAPHGEAYHIKPSVLEEYRQRFKRVYLFYDNDKAGRLHLERNTLMYKLQGIYIPLRYYPKVKDFSDFVRQYGIFAAEEVLFKMLKTM